MSDGVAHVVGAGLAGLSAAIRLSGAGLRIVLYEAAKAAGGRCRSYRDATLELEIDNGNHLLLTANRSAMAYVRAIGGESALTIADAPRFDFADLATGRRWAVRPNAGRIPWWILAPSRRVPDARLAEYLAPARLLKARPGQTVEDVMTCAGPLWDRLVRPVLLAALNTEPAEAAASLAAPILRETLAAGGDACRPIVATGGLSAAFVDPALASIARSGGEVRLGSRLRTIESDGDRVTALAFADHAVAIGPEDDVVLAVPPGIAQGLLPGLIVPNEHRAIVNAHFRIAPPAAQPLLLGLLGSVSEWLFAYPDRLSVTISAGDRLLDTPREELARLIWREVAAATGLGDALPVWQIVSEKRATFAATPAQAARRPGPGTRFANLALAGDWTATGLPATIEGAIRSGENAATLLQSSDRRISRSVSVT